MKNLYLFMLFIAGIIYSQDISNIRTLDTIFVRFKENKWQTKTIIPEGSKGFKRWYILKFKEKSKIEYLQFWVSEYPNYKRRELGVKSDYQLIKKSDLRKIKSKIIGIDFFRKYGIYRSTYEAFEKCKVIYILDYSEVKKDEIPIYEVTKSSSYIMGE